MSLQWLFYHGFHQILAWILTIILWFDNQGVHSKWTEKKSWFRFATYKLLQVIYWSEINLNKLKYNSSTLDIPYLSSLHTNYKFFLSWKERILYTIKNLKLKNSIIKADWKLMHFLLCSFLLYKLQHLNSTITTSFSMRRFHNRNSHILIKNKTKTQLLRLLKNWYHK